MPPLPSFQTAFALPQAFGRLVLAFLLVPLIGPWAGSVHAQAQALEPQAAAEGPRFVPNLGQWGDAVQEVPASDSADPLKDKLADRSSTPGPYRYKASLPDGALFVEDRSLTWSFWHPEDKEAIEEAKETGVPSPPGAYLMRGHAFRTVFPGAEPPESNASGESPEAAVVPLLPAEAHYRNYFLGRDAKNWRSQVPEHAGVAIQRLWPGVDMRLYAAQGSLKYDFVLAPGVPSRQVLMAWEGLDGLRIHADKLVLRHSAGQLIEQHPLAYQDIDGERVVIACRYEDRGGGRVGFALDPYDTRFPLVIDPVLVFATFSGSTEDNWGYSATYDENGHAFGGGIAFGTGYPVTMGAFQTSFGGGALPLPCDISITKYTPDGSGQVWSTYLGGSGNEFPQSMVASPSGELFVYGSTGSTDFPLTGGAWDILFNGGNPAVVTSIDFPAGSDIYVARISADGANLLASTYVGGNGNDGLNLDANLQYNYGDHARGEIILANDGGPIVASSTYSPDFPIGSGAADPVFSGVQDGVLFHLDPNLENMLWSTFLGGTQADGAYSVKQDGAGQLLVCGGTRSADLPVGSGGIIPVLPGGQADGWLMRLTGNATSILAGTFLGTSAYDQAYFVEFDGDNEVYVTGQTRGSYPIVGSGYGDPGASQFIHKLSADLSSTVYSTAFGNGASTVNISPTAFLVDVCENVYVSGWGGVVNNGFNLSTGDMLGMPLTADAYQSSTDGSDFYFFVLAKNAVSLLYASYFGGGLTGGVVSREHVDGGTSRFDRNGVIYQAVCAGCGGLDAFPVTPGAWSETNGASNCNLGTLKFSFDLGGVEAVSDAFPAITGCAPFTVDFTNLSAGAEDYIWDFGDGSPTSTLFEPSHTYVLPDTYSVQLIAIDSNSCNIADTSYLTIIAGIDSIAAMADLTQSVNCDTLWASFSDSSLTLGPTTLYTWNMGDGTIRDDTTGFTYLYTTPGVYAVSLILFDSTSCNLRDTVTWTIDYESAFDSNFDVVYNGCAPVTASFTNTNRDADGYSWNFGDGNSGSGLDPTHVYAAPGLYAVSLVTEFCGIFDTLVQNIEVPNDPIAYFEDEPYAVILGSPANFINGSQFANSYLWSFGDGSSSADVNPSHTYANPGTYTVCLIARSPAGCEDEYCREIDVEFEGFIDVPNAFTPNGDGSNDLFIVRGFGVDQFRLRIFNRWGELVHESRNINAGWDGRFRGQEQPMDAYAWQLEARFSNGRKATREGNVTLIR